MIEARPAGFWIRACALIVDFVVFALVQSTFAFGAARLFGAALDDDLSYPPSMTLFMLLFTLLYTSAMHSIAGQTIGKMVVRVEVVGADGHPPGFGTAVLRYLGYFVSLATFTLGFLMAALRRDKRGLHDLIAGTSVVRVPRDLPAPPPPPPSPVEPEPATVIEERDPSTSGYL